jgi:hypothetical protein
VEIKIQEQEKSLETILRVLMPLQRGLELYKSKIDGLEYFAHDEQGGIVPGIKAYEYDLKKLGKNTQENTKKMAELRQKIDQNEAQTVHSNICGSLLLKNPKNPRRGFVKIVIGQSSPFSTSIIAREKANANERITCTSNPIRSPQSLLDTRSFPSI